MNGAYPSSAGAETNIAAPRAGVRTKLLLTAAAALAFILLFLVINIRGDWQYALTRRLLVVAAVVLSAAATGGATVIFQTLTHNRILTPSIIGLDSLYVLMQTAVVFVLGAASTAWTDATVHFVLSAGLLAAFASLLYHKLFSTERFNVYFILLIGLIAGTLFQSLSSFLQMTIDPNEFLVAQGRMFATFNNVRPNVLVIAAAAIASVVLYVRPYFKYLDVLALGREHAINLGVDYNRVVRRLWTAVILLTAVATALVGPITFLGLLTVNLAHQLLRDYRHTTLLAGTCLIGIALLSGGLLLVERVFAFATPVSVIVNLAGGVYFLYLVLKESQA